VWAVVVVKVDEVMVVEMMAMVEVIAVIVISEG
jgi:hypothetical protein